VSFERGDNLTDVAVKHLAEKCQSLQSANCARCEQLTDEAFKRLAERRQAGRARTARGATSSRTKPSSALRRSASAFRA